MSKNTIFGEENFIDKKMVAISENIETALIDDIYKTTLQIRFDINKQKLERWLRFCAKLENIEQTELIDMATKKKIADLKHELDQLNQQLEEYKNKENTYAVNSWDEMLKNCENCGLNECIGCEYTQTCVQNIKQQLEEKDKEIEKLKQQYTILENENGKLTTDLIMDKYKKAQKEVSFGKQLAIQELAEVERLLYESHYKEIDNRYYAEYEDIKNLIDSRIKALEELKGEKDEV